MATPKNLSRQGRPVLQRSASLSDIRDRSLHLSSDPKLHELRHFLNSHKHEDRLRSNADNAALSSDNDSDGLQRLLGGRLHDQQDQKVFLDTKAGESRSPIFIDSRLSWRNEMDRNIRRLLQDNDLVFSAEMDDDLRHQMRCDQLDRTHAWLMQHAPKEADKEREGPPFVMLDSHKTPPPGSLRRAMSHSRSANTLRIAGKQSVHQRSASTAKLRF
eukprot:CAMPEP_0172864244 /NCGR_PEP_ID=MMETSP1075-20121228/79677_1 /TAXON_ID=2916 /ORGANISM="Ceratium fusus, Strain PA161109" /LENGTH=215 /DNA_ID=CAMNT_0013713079 /DNA_START=71 /DNA_END=718 /DNA_ORIENTATION=-